MDEITLKIGLIGNQSVGKSNLIRSFVDNRFEDNYLSTIGVDYFEKEIIFNNKKIKLIIQDTSGEERFRCISKNYYNNVDGIIFVFDVNNLDSFNAIIKYWLKECDNQLGEYKKILVGNNIGLSEDMRVVSKEKINKYVESKQIKYFEINTKEGTNVNIIFKELVELILKDFPEKKENKNYKLVYDNNNSSKKKCC